MEITPVKYFRKFSQSLTIHTKEHTHVLQVCNS